MTIFRCRDLYLYHYTGIAFCAILHFMTRADLKRLCCKPLSVCCIILSLISLVLFFPAVRLFIVTSAERLFVHRTLRSHEKWSHVILLWAGCQLFLSLAAIFFSRSVDLKSGKGIVALFSSAVIFVFVVQNLFMIIDTDLTGWYMDSVNLWDHYVSVLSGKRTHLGMYPPLATFIYRIYASMTPPELLAGDWTQLAYSDAGSYLTLLYYLFSVMPFCLICYDSAEGKKSEKILLTVAVCCSAPFLYSLMRGNIVLFSCCAAFFFCRSLSSEKLSVRVAGLVALFVAVGTKLYPIAYAALLVKGRRWKELKYCLLTVALLFAVMLVFFEGGLSEIANMVRSITGFTSTFTEHHNISLKRQLWGILSCFGAASGSGFFPVLDVIVYAVYLAASVVMFLLTKERWVELMLLTLSCLLLPGIVRPYTEIFLVIPLIEMLGCRKKDLFVYLSLLFLLPMMLFICQLSVFITFHSFLVTFPLFALCAGKLVSERRKVHAGR